MRPSFYADFANSKRVDPRIISGRTTTGTRTAQQGRIEVAPTGTPRVDFDLRTGECLGLLYEPGATNLLPFSVDLSTGWIRGSAATWAASVDSVLKPTGTAVEVSGLTSVGIGTTGTTVYRAGNAVSAGSTYTFSVYVKPVPGTLSSRVALRIIEAGGASSSSIHVLNPTGWTRVTQTVTISAGVTAITVLIGGADGDPVVNCRISCAQLELGAIPTTYIPTTSAQVTRAADVITSTPIDSWLSEAEGTILVSFRHYNASAADTTILALDDGLTGQANQHVIRASGSGATIRYTPRGDAVALGDVGIAAIPLGSQVRAVAAFGNNIFRASANGSIPVGFTAASQPSSITRLRIGQRGADSSVRMCGHIQQIMVYPKMLTDAQIQRLGSE